MPSANTAKKSYIPNPSKIASSLDATREDGLEAFPIADGSGYTRCELYMHPYEFKVASNAQTVRGPTRVDVIKDDDKTNLKPILISTDSFGFLVRGANGRIGSMTRIKVWFQKS